MMMGQNYTKYFLTYYMNQNMRWPLSSSTTYLEIHLYFVILIFFLTFESGNGYKEVKSLSCLSFIIRLLVFVCHLINLRFRWPRICRYILRIIWLWSLSDSMKIWCEIPITSTRKGAYFFIHVSYLKQFKKMKIVCTFKRSPETMS